MAERRQADRVTTTSGALMFFHRRRGVFTCELRDITDMGIGLRLNDLDVIARMFNVMLDNFSSVQLYQVIWSRGRYIGAIFRQHLNR
jgi:hypothetical protein